MTGRVLCGSPTFSWPVEMHCSQWVQVEKSACFCLVVSLPFQRPPLEELHFDKTRNHSTRVGKHRDKSDLIRLQSCDDTEAITNLNYYYRDALLQCLKKISATKLQSYVLFKLTENVQMK